MPLPGFLGRHGLMRDRMDKVISKQAHKVAHSVTEERRTMTVVNRPPPSPNAAEGSGGLFREYD